MITRQHTAIFVMELATRAANSGGKFFTQFEERIPYVLLPDAIRAYISPRQASHFERTPNGRDVSWMEFPRSDVLKSLTKENAAELIRYQVADVYPKCAIGEDSSLDEFDRRNYGHRHYNDLRVHLVQDICLDQILREKMVDCTRRFDDKFVLRHNRDITLDGKALREQIALFEELGFIHLCGKVYERTGMVLDGSWFNQYVVRPLLNAYPEDLADKTFSFMRFSDELNERIRTKNFELTEEEKRSVIITDDLIYTLDELYSKAAWYTFSEV